MGPTCAAAVDLRFFRTATAATTRQKGEIMQQAEAEHPNPAIAYLLWLLGFVLVCGIHRFYTGRWITGLIWILTGGVLWIGQFIDLFLIPGHCRNPKW
jgi:hypothetical protein